MRTRARGWIALLLLLALAPGGARAEPREGRVRAVIGQRLLLLLNPMGMEHTLTAGFRARLGDPRELLFMGAHAETGLVSYVSPVYAITGGYVQVSPLAFLVVRAELTHAVVWPIGMEGAGYYGLGGYDDDVRPEQLTAERGATATGWSLRLSATLQGLVPLGDGARLLVQDQLTAQHASLGDASHYYDMKWDLVLARQDWALINHAVLLLEVDLGPGLHLRVGAYDDARYVPASGHVGHQVGPIAMLAIDRPAPEVPEVTPFLRGGYYTDHVLRREELTVLGGLGVTYDLGAAR